MNNSYECGTAEANLKPKFNACSLADISTCHITEKDGRLLSNPALYGHVASIDAVLPGDEPPGDIFWVPQNEDMFRVQLQEFKDIGFSETFLNLFQLLRDQHINYVKIDADGSEVPGLPTFEW